MNNNTFHNILDYGAVGDGCTDSTEAFAEAFAAGDFVIVPKQSAPYLVRYLSVPEGKYLLGIDQPQVDVRRGDSTILSIIRSNSIIDNIFINSLDENLANNRIAIEDAKNVTVKNCRIEGFRHIDSDMPNAWGLFINKSSVVKIMNCTFNNNTQSDIAIVDSCSYIEIDGCGAVCERFVINIEPNGIEQDTHIKISRSTMSDLYLLENNFLTHSIDSVLVQECRIGTVLYRGANVTFLSCRIDDIEVSSRSEIYGGKINTIDTFGLGENINSDPLFHCILPQDSNAALSWVFTYTPDGNTLTFKEDDIKGRYLQFNTNGENSITTIERRLPVEALQTYAIRSCMNIFYPTGSGAANTAQLCFYDTDNKVIGECKTLVVDRKDGADGRESTWDEKTVLFQAPARAVSVCLSVSSASPGSISRHVLNIKYILVNKVLLDTHEINDREIFSHNMFGPNTELLLPVGTKGNMQSLDGQVIYKTDTSSGWVCVQKGNPGVWQYVKELEQE